MKRGRGRGRQRDALTHLGSGDSPGGGARGRQTGGGETGDWRHLGQVSRRRGGGAAGDACVCGGGDF